MTQKLQQATCAVPVVYFIFCAAMLIDVLMCVYAITAVNALYKHNTPTVYDV
jgi:hypothetical protein